jgi:hypothetical protein
MKQYVEEMGVLNVRRTNCVSPDRVRFSRLPLTVSH